MEREVTVLLACLSLAGDRLIFTATLLKTLIVLNRQHGEVGQGALNLLLNRVSIRSLELDHLAVDRALWGWRRFGKGNHPAGLTIGDCFSYGLAMALSAPLLFS